MDGKKKVLFYGAGEHAAMIYRHAARKSAAYGEPTAFIDRDIYKQRHDLFDLPVISWEDARKRYGDDFYIYVTGNEKAAPEILGFLQEQGVPKERVINWEPVEKRLGCAFAESYFLVEPIGGTIRYFNCNRNSDNLIYIKPEFKYIVEHSIAAHSDIIKRGVDHTRDVAEKVANGDREKQHLNCANMCQGYYYSERKIRSLNYVGTGICNFKCCYCVLNHHADYEPITFQSYPVFLDVFRQLKHLRYIDDDTVIKISSGEFSVAPYGNQLVELASKHPMTIFSNAYVYSPQTAAAMDHSTMLLCNTDSGCKETFHKVKGIDGFERVKENLKEYAAHGPVTLKYILLDGVNDSPKDLEGFFRLADDVAAKVDLIRDFMDTSGRFSVHALDFAAHFIKYFRDAGKLNMNLAAFMRSGEEMKLKQILEAL